MYLKSAKPEILMFVIEGGHCDLGLVAGYLYLLGSYTNEVSQNTTPLLASEIGPVSQLP